MTQNKEVFALTESAAEQVSKLVAAKGGEALGIRIGVKKGGCSGLSYTFEYCYKEDPRDDKVISHGVPIYIDPGALLFIIGTTLDFVDKTVEKGFVFLNPNEKGKCGCGESFTT